DGRTVLFTVETAGTPTTTRMAAVSLANGDRKTILDQAAAVQYLPTGHLLFVRSGQIEAQAFDRRRLVLRGPSLSVLPEVRIDPSGPAAQLAVSRNGALVYVSADHRSNLRSLVWADPKGAMERITVSQGVFSYPRISPDGARLAVVAYTPEGTARLCTVGTAAGDIAPLQTEGNSIMPLWTPDGRWITFASDKEGQWNIYMIPADGTGGAALLLKGDHPRVPTSWSADGRHLCLTEFHPASGADIWILSVRDSRAWPFLQRAGGEWGGVFSPDGAWLSYTSNESGPNHVYVRPFPGPGEPFQVSTAQGEEPVWAAGGLFYRYWDRLMSVAFPRGAGAAPEAPQLVLEGAFEKSELPAFQNYDVAGGGARFVFVTGDRPSTVLHFRYDWFAELARLLSGSPPD
ncbi:MAG: hypothetical protein FJW35_01440, partial [Acidobacteria bacterium]|nr:hypothetical protein [Acidobacteriota bacterium]